MGRYVELGVGDLGTREMRLLTHAFALSPAQLAYLETAANKLVRIRA